MEGAAAERGRWIGLQADVGSRAAMGSARHPL